MSKDSSLFADDLSNPDAWMETAEQLLYSASLMEAEIRVRWGQLKDQIFRETPRPKNFIEPARIQSVFMMVCSFGIENLFKASIVAKNRAAILSEATSKGSLPSIIDGHELVSLATSAGFKPTVDQEILLRHLTENALWFGRYSMTTKAKNYTTSRYLSDGSEMHVGTWAESDIDDVKQLVESIADDLGCPNPWEAAA